MNYKDSFEDDMLSGMRWFGAWWFWVAVLVLATAAGSYYVWPWFANRETEVTRQSNQYITTKQSALRTMKLSYDELEVQIATLSNSSSNSGIIISMRVQQRSLVDQMKQEADLIPGHVPQDIAEFLNSK